MHSCLVKKGVKNFLKTSQKENRLALYYQCNLSYQQIQTNYRILSTSDLQIPSIELRNQLMGLFYVLL